MHVPKATVDEDHLFQTREDEVGFPREVFPMKPVAVAQGVRNLPDQDFGFRVLAPNPRHAILALFERQVVGHGGHPVVPRNCQHLPLSREKRTLQASSI